MIVGKKVRLRRPEGQDHQTLVAWRNDPQIKQFFFEEEPITLESHLNWYSRIEKDPDERFYVIDALNATVTSISQPPSLTVDVVLDPPRLIGRIGLANINWRNRTAEGPARFLVVEGHRGRGYGFEALYLLLDYAFNHLNLHKVWAEVIAGNKVPIKLYSEMGFREEGILEEQVFKSGKYIGVIRFGLLIDNFRYLQSELREKIGL